MKNKYSIGPLIPQYIERVAYIHRDSLPDDFLPNLGLDFLANTFYPAALESKYGKAFVALENEINPVGFILVTLESGAFLKDIIKNHFWDFLKIGFRSSFSSISNLVFNLQIVISGLFSNASQNTGEIYIIAVSEMARGKGVGSQLVKQAETFMQECKIAALGIKTLSSNKDWIGFFTKNGWEIKKELQLIGNDYVWLETHI
jgi:ribosomal protein S18 acetylase RimI-like enzyme